jgi:tetratricopeptide (TPR) repeat protein
MTSLVLVSCATEPEPVRSPERETVNPEQLKSSPLVEETKRKILIASPASLRQARERLLREPSSPELDDLLFIVQRLLEYLYPEIAPMPDEAAGRGAAPAGSVYPKLFELIAQGIPPASINTDPLTRMLSMLPAFKNTGQDDSARVSLNELRQFDAIEPRSVLTPLIEGTLAERRNDPETALERYRTALERDPSCYPASIGSARILIRHDRHAEAVSALEAITEPVDRNAEIPALLAEALAHIGSYEEAVLAADRSLALSPDHGRLYFIKASAAGMRAEWNTAVELLQTGERYEQLPEELALLKARALFETGGSAREAVGVIERFGIAGEEDLDTKELYGRLLFRAGRATEGAAVLDSVYRADPSRESLTPLLLSQFAADSDYSTAAFYADKVIAANPSDEQLELAFRIYILTERPRDALNAAQRLSERHPARESYIMDRARLLSELDMKTELLELATTALRNGLSGKSRGELFYLRSTVQSDPDARLQDLRSALIADPLNVKAVVSLSEYYVSVREYRKAYLYMKQAVTLSPGDERNRRELERLERLLQEPPGSAAPEPEAVNGILGAEDRSPQNGTAAGSAEEALAPQSDDIAEITETNNADGTGETAETDKTAESP